MLREERVIKAAVVLLLLVLSFQVLLMMGQKSVTTDEMIFLKTGYVFLKTGDLRLDDVNPPLVMLMSAAPLLFLDLETNPAVPASFKGREYGSDFLFYNQSPGRILFLSRLPTLLLSLMLGLLVFKWASGLYGPRAGLLALFSYVFTPVVTGLSGLAALDLGASFFIVLALYLFRGFLAKPSLFRLCKAGVGLGLALSAKHTALLLVPVLVVFSVVYVLRKGAAGLPSALSPYGRAVMGRVAFVLVSAFVVVLVCTVAINIVHGLNGSGMPIGELPFVQKEAFKEHPVFSKLLSPYTRWIPVPFPHSYLRGVGSTLARTSMPGTWPSFLMGEFSTGGWWYYFIVAFAIKTPIPFLILIVLSVLFFRQLRHRDWFEEFYLLLPVVVMFYLASRSSVQIGIRHIVVVYPLLTIFVAKAANIKLKQRVIATASGLVLALWFVVSSASVHPHYLAYFNELTGGPENGYKYLIDSNVDWGQDVDGLVRYMDREGIPKIKFGKWVVTDPAYDSRFEPLDCGPQGGPIAVQANVLQGLTEQWGTAKPGCYEWLRKRSPEGRVGYSILLYGLNNGDPTFKEQVQQRRPRLGFYSPGISWVCC